MRKVININKGWRFLQEEVPMPQSLPEGWQTVDLPHTWNAVDGHDGSGGYDSPFPGAGSTCRSTPPGRKRKSGSTEKRHVSIRAATPCSGPT